MPAENAIRLSKLLPRNWEKAFGYNNESNWLIAYWGAGDEAYYEDAKVSSTANWQLYLWLIQDYLDEHEIDIALAGTSEGRYSLGSSDNYATHCLLFNLKSREIFITSKQEAVQLMRQNQLQQTVTLSREQWKELEKQLAYNFDQHVAKVTEWFNATQPCRNCGMGGWIMASDKGFDKCPACKGKGRVER